MGLQIIQSALNHKRKKYFRFWLHHYYGAWTRMHHLLCIEKIQSDSTLTEKNIYFCFWLQYYYGGWNLEKNQSEFVSPQKKNPHSWLQYYYSAWDL